MYRMSGFRRRASKIFSTSVKQVARGAVNSSKLRLSRRSGSNKQLLRFVVLFFTFRICAFLLRASTDAMHRYSRARSLLIITALDVTSVETLMKADSHQVRKDIAVPRSWAGLFVQLRHVILISDRDAYDAFFNLHLGYSLRSSHVHIEFVPEFTTYAAKVHYAVSVHKNFRFIMLWDFVNFRFSRSVFSEICRFAKSQSPFMLHYESRGVQSISAGSVTFESYALDDILDVDRDSLLLVKSWEMMMMRSSLFITVGGLQDFTHCGYSCFVIKIRLEGARLWQLKVPEISMPITRSRENISNATWVKLSETCSVSTDVLAKFLPSSVTRNGRKRIALVHEMVPTANQGGNIRLIEILDVFLANGFHVHVFVRKNIREDMTIIIKGKHTVQVWADNFQLTKFGSRIEEFDFVISAMSFWNRPLGLEQDLTIPLIVDAILASSMRDIKHVVITDDIHASRCFQTEMGDAFSCSKVRHQEEYVWSSFRMLKVFVSREDLAHAASVVPEAHDTMTFLPYMFDTLAQTIHSNAIQDPIRIYPFKLAYFGKAHPANVMAVNTLLEALSQTKHKLYGKVQLLLVGDENWSRVREVKVNAHRKRKDIPIQVHGELANLDYFLNSVDLVLAPVTVGGTGVSSKIFKCIEMRIPFVSTREAIRGFECDDECRDLFFAETIEDMLRLVQKTLYESERTTRMINKLTHIGRHLTHAHVGKNAHLMLALSNSPDYVLSSQEHLLDQQLTARVSSSSHEFACEVSESQANCLELCELKHPSMRGTPLILSVYSSLLGGQTERQFLEAFVADILNQCFDRGAWEIVIASANNEVLIAFRSAFVRQSRGRKTECLSIQPDVRTVLLRHDEGLYETWDWLIQNFTKGQFLTNWNVDDRKHRQALSIKVRVLENSPKIDVVSSSVFVSTTVNRAWNSCQSARLEVERCEVWFKDRGRYALSAFVQTDSKSGKITNVPQNYPHNAPVYRRSIHSLVGYFSSDKTAIEVLNEKSAPTCFDWKLWVKLAAQGGVFFNVNIPLEVYYIRANSHGRRDATSGEHCVEYVFQTLREKGLLLEL